MATIKTAISLEQSLFAKVDELVKEMNVSRNRLFTVALEAFIERHEEQKLLAQLNAAYEDAPDEEEELTLQGMRRIQRELARGEW